MDSSITKGTSIILPVLPLKNVVALPKSIIPVVVGRDISVKAVEAALATNKEVFITAQKVSTIENPNPDDLFSFGTRGVILQSARMSNGMLKILVEGVIRAEAIEFSQTEGYFAAVSRDIIIDPLSDTPNNQAMWRNLLALFKEYIGLNEKIAADIITVFHDLHDLDYLADTVAVQMNLDFSERQRILEMADLKERVIRLSSLLKNEIEILKAERNIRKRVQNQVEKNQKDYYLTEQIRAIQRELGRDDYQQDIDEMRAKAKKLHLPAEAAEKVEAECRRLEQMQPTSPESAVSRNYVEWIISVPWDKYSKDAVGITQAEKILESTHAGMKKPKERIIEFLAAKKFAGDKLEKTPILCLVGPPGVGKTSLAASIAKALGRTMVRISLGGIRDEADIRGHRRTYIGAMPGKVIQALRKAKTANPVIVLDEIDKMATDFRGDPASALLEVLDPEQNKAFVDHFLEIDYDLSKVMFIATANVIDNIPYPLIDRMEIVSLSGYTDEEKFAIAHRFLISKLLKEHALKASQIKIPDTLVRKIIDGYTKEAGVRQLERVLAKLMRKSIQLLLEQPDCKKIEVTPELFEKWLGPVKFKPTDILKSVGVGVVTGVSWTEVGGEVLDIEVTLMKGKGALTLTGQLGEVMQESAQAALSYIRSRAKEFGLKENFYSGLDVHVHLPEGAIPKDGPSAGVTIATALTSALTNIPLKPRVTMTGEVTLRGRVLAIGGLKEKLLAAIRYGFTKAIIPEANRSDYKEIANELAPSFEVVFVETMDQVLAEALERSPFVKIKKKAVSKKVVSSVILKKKKSN